MRRKRIFFALTLLIACTSMAMSSNLTPPVSQISQETAPAPQQSQADDIIHSGPADQKEKVGILFFLGWVWLGIGILVYFLRQKIKETDRLFESGYYSNGREKSCQED